MPAGRQVKVTIAIPVLLTGGTEMQTVNLIKALHGEGYSVVVLCYYDYENDMTDYMQKAGAEVVLLKLKREDGLFSLLKKLIVEFKKHSADIVHVQYIAPGLIAIIAARLAGVKKVIATVHQPGRTHGSKNRFLLRFASRLCDLFICVSRSVETSWFGDSALFDSECYRAGRKHFTIYNAVDNEKIAREAGSENVDRLRDALHLEEKKVVGYVGRLRSEKGPKFLIDAFARVIRTIPEAVLLVVGDGPDRQALEQQAEKLSLETNIIWLGKKSQQEVYQLYGLMDVVAIPSLYEGFGLTAAEALAAGVPVVGSNVDGLKEVLDDSESTILVEAGNYFELADSVIEMLNRRPGMTQPGGEGENFNNRFSVHYFINSILIAYRVVLE